MNEKSSAAEFLRHAGLFSPVKFEGGFGQPASMAFDCDHCGKETTWTGETRHSDLPNGEVLRFVCHLCHKKEVIFVILREYVQSASGQGWDHMIEKIGQSPAPSIAISRPLAKHLGTTADLYKKALICRNQGYGIAAVAYMRRIVEEKTDELIDIVADQARERGLTEKEIEGILTAKKEQTYSSKLKVAGEVIPASLRPGGATPFGTLFGLLSDGLHDRTEEECVGIADEIREVFEYVFENLRAQIADEKRFKDRVSKLASLTRP